MEKIFIYQSTYYVRRMKRMCGLKVKRTFILCLFARRNRVREREREMNIKKERKKNKPHF